MNSRTWDDSCLQIMSVIECASPDIVYQRTYWAPFLGVACVTRRADRLAAAPRASRESSLAGRRTLRTLRLNPMQSDVGRRHRWDSRNDEAEPGEKEPPALPSLQSPSSSRFCFFRSRV